MSPEWADVCRLNFAIRRSILPLQHSKSRVLFYYIARCGTSISLELRECLDKLTNWRETETISDFVKYVLLYVLQTMKHLYGVTKEKWVNYGQNNRLWTRSEDIQYTRQTRWPWDVADLCSEVTKALLLLAFLFLVYNGDYFMQVSHFLNSSPPGFYLLVKIRQGKVKEGCPCDRAQRHIQGGWR
jgi:hypothetical protein